MFAIVFIASFFGTAFITLFALLGSDHFRTVLQRIKRRKQRNAEYAKMHDRYHS